MREKNDPRKRKPLLTVDGLELSFCAEKGGKFHVWIEVVDKEGELGEPAVIPSQTIECHPNKDSMIIIDVTTLRAHENKKVCFKPGLYLAVVERKLRNGSKKDNGTRWTAEFRLTDSQASLWGHNILARQMSKMVEAFNTGLFEFKQICQANTETLHMMKSLEEVNGKIRASLPVVSIPEVTELPQAQVQPEPPIPETQPSVELPETVVNGNHGPQPVNFFRRLFRH